MELSSFDGGDDGEHSGVGLVEISKIFAFHDFISMGHHHLMHYNTFSIQSPPVVSGPSLLTRPSARLVLN